MNEEIKKLSDSKSESDRRLAIGLLETYLQQYPLDGQAWYEKACCHDFLGEERAAEPCYRKCHDLGWQKLPLKEQASFFVGFGSTLRNNFKFTESIALLSEGIQAFPDYPALKAFLAFSYYSNRQDKLAAEILFKALLESASKGFDGYEKAIQWYVENLATHPEKRDRQDTIEVVPADSQWPKQFAQLAEKLKQALGDLALSIDHIGSTSVPGLAAKPRIDVQITIAKLNESFKKEFDAALERAGFPASRHNQDHRPPGDKGPASDWDKLYLSGTHPELGFRSNIHVRVAGAPNQIYPLLFRDYLRAHPDAAMAYEKTKLELMRFHPNDGVAYSELKDPVCDLIMVDARRWAELTGWKA